MKIYYNILYVIIYYLLMYIIIFDFSYVTLFLYTILCYIIVQFTWLNYNNKI